MSKSIRVKAAQGLIATRLVDIKTAKGNILEITETNQEEVERRIQYTRNVYGRTALFEAIAPLLVQRFKNNERIFDMAAHNLIRGNDLNTILTWFNNQGPNLIEYLKRITTERKGITWGIKRTATQNPELFFGQGDSSRLKEINILNEKGVLPFNEFDYIIVEPDSLEAKIVEMCKQLQQNDLPTQT